MSDTRNDAEQEMVNAGIASGIEDTLGSSLSGSFAPPDMKPPPAPEAPTPAQQISGSTDTEEDAGPVPGMEEWKDTYDSYLKDWHAESSLARQKAEETRKKIEDEHAAIAKRMEDEKKSKQKEEAEKKRQKEREEKLKKELADEKAAGISRRRAERGGGGDDRDKKVKEAWEMIKGGGGQSKEDTVSVGDARGVTPQDVKAGNVQLAGDAKKMVNPAASSSNATDSLPSTTRDHPPSPTLPSSSQTLSATSQTWTEVSGNTSSAEDLSPARSGSSEDNEVPPPTRDSEAKSQSSGVPARIPSEQHNTPPSQPPSLTLSMFTSPSNLSVSKVLAILGINIVLPFVNGVMLGFGEIFAREAVRTGRHWWNAGLGIFGRGAGSRGSSGAGLGGGRGF